MPNPRCTLAITTLAAILLTSAGSASAQSFYVDPNLSKQRRLEQQTQEEARRQRIADRKERLAVEAARRQGGVRLTDRDRVIVQRRYGNALPNRQGDTGTTTVQPTGNRSTLVPQR